MAFEPGVDRRVAQAKRQAEASAARSRATSAARLDALLQLPPAERFAHLDDAELKPEHRTTLRRSLRPYLPRPRPSLPWLKLWPRRARPSKWTSRLLGALLAFEITVPTALALTWAIMAWHNTKH